MRNSTPSRIVAAVLLLVGLSSALGQEVQTGSVTGKITFENGIPLGKGNVVFHPEQGKPISSRILADGTFEAKDVPPGKLRVTLDAEVLPKAYRDPKTTPLLVEIRRGKNNVDIRVSKK